MIDPKDTKQSSYKLDAISAQIIRQQLINQVESMNAEDLEQVANGALATTLAVPSIDSVGTMPDGPTSTTMS